MTPEEERARMIARMRCDGKEEEDLTPAEARKRMIARMHLDEWEESKHPRAKDGKFTSGSGASKTSEAESGENTAKRAPKSGTPLKFVKTTPSKFNAALKAAKKTRAPEDKWRVDDTHSEEDYKNAKLFQTKGGSVGAVDPDGDIISLCKNKNSGERGRDVLGKLIENGGKKLDAFGKGLFMFYTKNGFEPVSWTEFDENYAPHDWKPEYGKEPVIFYKYTGRKNAIGYDEFINGTKPYADYDGAKEYRDKEMQ